LQIAEEAPKTLLEVEDVHSGYGETQIIFGVGMKVREGEIVSLIGPNGAGKTTLLKTVAGVLAPYAGRIQFAGSEIAGLPAHHVIRLGLCYVPEGRGLFSGMTVEENLLVGSSGRRVGRREIESDLERAYGYFSILKERRKQLAGKLSGGEQQMCAIARGLMSRPKLMIVDEFSLGLAPLIVQHLLEIIGEIRETGVSLLVVEQDVELILELSDRGYVLEQGLIRLSGNSKELLNREEIRTAFLGL
jgi:branched-chain amino acid transport system ATP-binding protein